ncbi:MAG: tetratricopeptide repeat protein [Bacteroidales bacterium]|jgi:tetratricopeptide (TPR) repeat protein|nr:tetratricopeptide repeat protein [Bacteroidales bacterium]
MDEKRLKLIFRFSALLLLVVMMLAARKAGINCDEVLHYDHSVDVYNYFATGGRDTAALHTPVTHLQYYGQSYDNIVTFLIKWTGIRDVYGFRHIMSTLAGWLTIVVTALFAVWFRGYKAGLLTLFLFAVSPTFLGHSQHNLKDVPFALAYISGIFLTLKVMYSDKKLPVKESLLLILSVAFCIGIRAGGLLLVCYVFFFFFIYYAEIFIRKRLIDFRGFTERGVLLTLISVSGIFLSIILWPYALKDPLRNIIESYRVMAHFPDTFRQIFEGKVMWSDNMPWYYLLKSMGITIPLVVLAGLVLFLIFARKWFSGRDMLKYVFLVFTVVFPLIFVVFEDSNLYSSWRQFLFVYPGLVLVSSLGFHALTQHIQKKPMSLILAALLVFAAVHPVKFMILNTPYSYIYYNQLVGGLKGAYGNYETDYYYVSQTEASEWLIDYLEEKGSGKSVKVKATYSVKWQFRDHPEIETSYFRFVDRSQYDWDYAIAVNRYIHPYQLKNNIWPPDNAIHLIYADDIPVCAILERRSKDDYHGFIALKNDKNEEAIAYFQDVLKINYTDELIFYNFATALFNNGQYEKADSVLKKGLEINPDCEPIIMFLGNIARDKGYKEEAIGYYRQLIGINRKSFEAYVELAKLLSPDDLIEARNILRSCLTLNPRYKPAIIALADTYRTTDPDIAEKYDKLVNTIE